MVAAPTLSTPLPSTTTVVAGEPLALAVTATPVVGTSLGYAWTHDGTAVGTDPGVDVAEATADDAGVWEVVVTATRAGQEASTTSTTTVAVTPRPVVAPALPPAGQGSAVPPTGDPTEQSRPPDRAPAARVPLVWDEAFAKRAVTYGGTVLGALLVVLAVAAIWATTDARLALVALLAISAVLLVAGATMALIDLRGQARVAAAPETQGRGGWGDVVTAAPAIIEKFGSLGLASAVLLLAAVAMVCATTIAVHTPGPGSSPTPTVTSTVTSAVPSTAATTTP